MLHGMRLVALGMLLALVLVASFGITVGMHDDTGPRTSCPQVTPLHGQCPMSLQDHAQAWQQAFSAVLQAVAFDAHPVARTFDPLSTAVELAPVAAARTVEHRWRPPPAVDPLRAALSTGILHPKLYA